MSKTEDGKLFLSRVELNPYKEKTLRALESPNLFHGAIESSLPGERVRNLWRIDTVKGRKYILLLTQEIPELSCFISQFGFEKDPSSYSTKEYGPFVGRIKDGQKWSFRLTANPVTRAKNKASACTGKDRQLQWLLDRAEGHGFAVDDISIKETKWLDFLKGRERYNVHIFSVQYEGILTVTDSALFKKALSEGIGREKAYGMGLLTVM